MMRQTIAKEVIPPANDHIPILSFKAKKIPNPIASNKIKIRPKEHNSQVA